MKTYPNNHWILGNKTLHSLLTQLCLFKSCCFWWLGSIKANDQNISRRQIELLIPKILFSMENCVNTKTIRKMIRYWQIIHTTQPKSKKVCNIASCKRNSLHIHFHKPIESRCGALSSVFNSKMLRKDTILNFAKL